MPTEANPTYEAGDDPRPAIPRIESSRDCVPSGADEAECVQGAVDHPKHYTGHKSGIECVTLTEQMTFCVGNAFKYLFRRNLKHESPLRDLEKAVWYLERAGSRMEGPTIPVISNREILKVAAVEAEDSPFIAAAMIMIWIGNYYEAASYVSCEINRLKRSN